MKALVAHSELAADHFCDIFGGACTADVLGVDGVGGCLSKQAMSLGLARLTIESISRCSRILDLVIVIGVSSLSLSSRKVAQ